jgi:ribonucleotide monophosphatase NagD (HAD superfamily)
MWQVVEEVEQADFVLAHGTECLGRGDGQEPVPIGMDQIRELLRAAAARQLPLLVANPDFVTVDGDELRVMPGTFGGWYAEMGGEVRAYPTSLPLVVLSIEGFTCSS